MKKKIVIIVCIFSLLAATGGAALIYSINRIALHSNEVILQRGRARV